MLSIGGDALRPDFTLGVRANVQSKSSISIGEKVENQPPGLDTRCQGCKILKKNSICPPSY
jgi:hypothetical protein